MAAAVVAITAYGGTVKVVRMAWTSSDAGAATGVVNIDGEIARLDTNPGATAPTDNYDVTLVDDITGLDILGGAGANRDTSTTESVVPTLLTTLGAEAKPVHYGTATLTVANAGDTKDGDIYLFYR